MQTANGIFVTHLLQKQSRRRRLEQKIACIKRTITAATAAAISSKEDGDEAACKKYAQAAEKAKADAEETQKSLDEVRKPIPQEEGIAAWEEYGQRLNADLAGRLAAYEESRAALAEELRQIMGLYEHILTERRMYSTACRPEDAAPKDFLLKFPVFKLDSERVLQDLYFYRQKGNIPANEADFYMEQLRTKVY